MMGVPWLYHDFMTGAMKILYISAGALGVRCQPFSP